jgi:hypothetical protein
MAVILAVSAAGQCHYTWQQLPSASGLAVHGQAINNLGWVTRLGRREALR